MHRFTMATLTLMILGAAASACETCDHGAACPAPKRAADQPEKPSAPAETASQKEYRETVEAVWAKVRATATLVPGENWPAGLDTEVVFVAVETVRGRGGTTESIAVAGKPWDEKTGKPVMKYGKFVPLVRITFGYIEVCDGDEHARALVRVRIATGRSVRGDTR